MTFQFLRKGGAVSTNRKIFRAALTVGLMGLLAKAALGGKELVVARWFGRSDALDAFLIAYLLPSFVMYLLTGALASALIPVLVEVRHKEDREAADRLISNVAFLGLISLTAIALLLALLAPYFLPRLGSGFSAEKLQLTRQLLYTLLPWVVLSGIAALASSVLNAEERFAFPAVIPVLTPLMTILFIALAARRLGPFSLAAGAACGSLLEAALLVYFLRANGTLLGFRWTGMDANLRSVLQQYMPMLAGAFLMGSATVIDQAMAAMLPGGSVAALNYANKIVNIAVTTAAPALSTAVLPYFSRMVAAADWQGCRHTLKRYSLLVAGASVPFTVLLIVMSRPLVRLIYQRGAFTAADTALVSSVQICYSFQIPFFILGMLFVRFLSSIRRNDLLMYGGAINLVIDVVLNLVLMRFMGVAGIALSTSLVYVCSFIFVAVFARRSLARQERPAAAPVLAGRSPSE
ncbi:MAG: murein biosynthesis integral membrane protein MurJ [Actinomycetota bacterium]